MGREGSQFTGRTAIARCIKKQTKFKASKITLFRSDSERGNCNRLKHKVYNNNRDTKIILDAQQGRIRNTIILHLSQTLFNNLSDDSYNCRLSA